MSDKNKIHKFEILGSPWGCEIKITTRHKGREEIACYSDVPKSLIMKFLNASKEPSATDFEGWYRDVKEAENKKLKDAHNAIQSTDHGFWGEKK